MKKGKTSKLQTHKSVRCSYGTVDSVNLKSIYLNLQTWVEPIKACDRWNRVVMNMSRDIKHVVFDSINRNIFNEKFIVDLDLRSSGIVLEKKSFMNLEITLFLLNNECDFKSNQIKESVKIISNNVINDVFSQSRYFRFHITKRENKTKTKLF
jgi:hypothetical protein